MQYDQEGFFFFRKKNSNNLSDLHNQHECIYNCNTNNKQIRKAKIVRVKDMDSIQAPTEVFLFPGWTSIYHMNREIQILV